MRRRMAFACAALAMATAISGTTAMAARTADSRPRNPRCSPPIKAGVTVTPLLTVGDDVGERLPVRGHPGRHLGADPWPADWSTLYVNHETSKVPFPYNTAGPRTAVNVAERLRQLTGEPADPERGTAACSTARSPSRAAAASSGSAPTTSRRARRASTRDILFTNEESPDYVFRQEDSWPPPIGDPDRGGERRRARARRRAGDVPADLRDGPAQPRERRRDPGVRRPGRHLGRRHLHQRTALTIPPGGPNHWRRPPRPSPSCTRTCRRTRRAARRRGRPLGVRLGRSRLRRLLRLHAELDPVGVRPLHQGAEEHRNREEPRRIRDQRPPTSATRRRRTDGTWQRDLRTNDPARHRWSSVGARVLEPAPQRLQLRPRRGHRVRQAARHGQRRLRRGLGSRDGGRHRRLDVHRTAACGRWCSTRTTRRRSTSLSVSVEGDDNSVKTPERDPSARQHRDDADRAPRDRGPGQQPAVHAGQHPATPPTRRRRASGTSRSRARPRWSSRSTSRPTSGGSRPT